MHVSIVAQLRQILGLDPPGTAVKVVEPYQMLGEIQPDLMDALGVDVIGLGRARTMFGYENAGWRPWTAFDGTPVLAPEGFNTELDPGGELLMYPEGDKSAPPSGIMLAGDWYFDSIARQPPIDDEKLAVADNLQEEAGFDILNPVQVSAAQMDAKELKSEFGDRITFWGGGVDTQKTLPFGTPDQVRAEDESVRGECLAPTQSDPVRRFCGTGEDCTCNV